MTTENVFNLSLTFECRIRLELYVVIVQFEIVLVATFGQLLVTECRRRYEIVPT